MHRGSFLGRRTRDDAEYVIGEVSVPEGQAPCCFLHRSALRRYSDTSLSPFLFLFRICLFGLGVFRCIFVSAARGFNDFLRLYE